MELDPRVLDGLPGAAPLAAACRDAARTERSVLRGLLAPATAFAAEHGLRPGMSLHDVRERVPVRTTADLRPWLDRQLAGEPALFVGPTALVARTTGTTGEPKHVPLPRAAVRAFREVAALWAAAFARDVPAMRDGVYLSLAWSARLGVHGDAPIAAVNGLAAGHDGALGGRAHALPDAIQLDPDPARRTAAVLAFARRLPLTAFGAPLPSLPLGLLDAAAAADLDPRRLWPDLAAIATWRAGPSARYLPRLRAHVGDLPIRDVGFAATEGPIGVALWPDHDGSLLTATHHVVELAPAELPVAPHVDTIAPCAAEVGRAYRLVVSTPAGLWRVDTEDVVVVVARCGQLPVFAFSHRAGTVGAVGERLSERVWREAMGACGGGDFVAQAVWPPTGLPFWRVQAVNPAPDLADRLDATLRRHELYARRRAAGTLGPVRVEAVDAVTVDPKVGHVRFDVDG